MRLSLRFCLFHPRYQNMTKLIRKYGDYARIGSSGRLTTYLLGIPFEVQPDKDFLTKKLDKALSNLIAFEEETIQRNRKIASDLIQSCGFPVKDFTPMKVYSYPTSELVFSIKDGELRCTTRFDNITVSNTNPSVYGKISLIDSLSPVDKKVLEDCGLNVISLIRYFSRPEVYKKKNEEHAANCEHCKSKISLKYMTSEEFDEKMSILIRNNTLSTSSSSNVKDDSER